MEVATEKQEQKTELLTVKQAAAELHCTPRHLRRLARAGRVPFVRLSVRCTRFSRAALVALATETTSVSLS